MTRGAAIAEDCPPRRHRNMGSEPPLASALKSLSKDYSIHGSMVKGAGSKKGKRHNFIFDDCTLPLIDLNQLNLSSKEQAICKQEITNAAATWAFFQVINHGIPKKVLKRLHHEQTKLFGLPFYMKSDDNFLTLPPNSYRWGNLAAKSPTQFMWSEALHIGVTDVSSMDEVNELRSSIEVFASRAEDLCKTIADILSQSLGMLKSSFFEESCSPNSCYVRLNRYPPCHTSAEVFGFMPHTDSDFLTILFQDEVGGLQLAKNGSWYGVRPIPDALIINIGDLFEAYSNGAYKSVQHRVIASSEAERLSLAYFFCPSYDTVIESCVGETQRSIYRPFSFREYKTQVQLDVQTTGDKVGLSRFLRL